ncbi:AfsA-related hotdog domain-containing protein [Actinoalloteichus hymeniacidonis]|uniref:A-factor biosynthesis repeat protein n=1 Tax=Actinoalloteichus hymeniacidonis TaxID=340345 RepID=A0AAC9N0Z4_9PSEU|nr:AfsA-related hotdog domain-containing protein [Actinoalloteichus hymeniacidonis]AOS65597.1 A-factor biosynthesis repeat protein [Actinoalloteichus hymeniacidonis]MBB5906313.1 hypothetical protein [Actinoalloteichus hymeniacidonis]
MTTPVLSTSTAPPGLDAAELSFTKTIDRGLVHRSSVSEVFVTDLHQAGELAFAAAAQLPLTHSYYNDHVARPAMVDPLLIVECARQAGIYGAHLSGVPMRTAMLVNSFTLRLDDPTELIMSRRPVELRIDSVMAATRVRGGVLRQGHAEQRFTIGGRPVGSQVMEIQMLSHHEHDALRHLQRGNPAPSTADMTGGPYPNSVAPGLVGRVHPMNVVLADVRYGADEVRAVMAPWYENRALFDHDYDHLPAMTLTEGARQLALLSVRESGATEAAGFPPVVGIAATFHRFAELDAPVHATTATEPAAEAGALTRTVVFTQDGITIATISISLAMPASIGERR